MNHYEIYVDGDKFYDPTIKELALIDPVLELAKNCAGTLTFQISPTHPKFNNLKPLTSTIEVYRDGEWFWEGRLIDDKSDFYNLKNCVVEGALAYLNDSVQPQAEYHDMTVIGYVERLLNIHNSMVAENRKIFLGAVTVKDTNDSLYRYTNFNKTLPELREDVVDALNGSFNVRKKNEKLYLDILADFNRTCSQVIRFGENLIDLTPEFDYTEIKSVIIPLGARLEDQEQHEELEALDKYVTIEDVNGGKNYIAREDLLEKYDKIWEKVQFQDIHLSENLLKKAENYLKDAQWGDMVIEAKAFDMNYTSEEFQEFRLGDRVRVKSEVHGIDRFFPITAQTIHFNDIAENTITLGGTGEPATITRTANGVTVTTEKLDEKIKEPNRLVQQAIYQATELINQGLNGYVRVSGNEILIMDTDDPETAKHVWRWNMGGLGYSSTGYNGPFETAITMDGTIAGRFIAAHSIAADQIDINYTSTVEQECNDYTDSKLKNYWTAKETEVQLKTNADSILSSVSSTYATKDDMGDVQTWIKSTEQKITEDGIFTTINNGIKGSKYITNTKFSMTKDGMTIQGGGIKIKNNAGTDVFYADSSGDLTMRGDFEHYAKDTGRLAVEIVDHNINLYAWYTSGDYVGSLGALHVTGSNYSEISLYSEYGSNVMLGSQENSSYNSTVEPIIELGSRNGSIGIKYIKGGITGTYSIGGSSFSYTNGLITKIDTSPCGLTGTFYVGDSYFKYRDGCISEINTNATGISTTVTVDGTRLTFKNGCLTNAY